MSDVLHAEFSLECVLLVPRASGDGIIHVVDNKRYVSSTVLRSSFMYRKEVCPIVRNTLK